MKKLLLLAALTSLVSISAHTEDAKNEKKSATPKIISAADATNYVDETVIVAGKVAQVTIREKMVYLNMDKAYPATPLSAVIFAAKTNLFADLEKLKDKNVELSGKITLFRDRSQIVIENTNQLKIVEAKKDPSESEKK